MSCPCGNQQAYSDCCARFIDKQEIAKTAEELMRSRYSAYTKENIDYIEKTQTLDPNNPFDKDEATQWAKDSQWLGLKIVSTQKGKEKDSDGQVEFIASYSDGKQEHHHHEKSFFVKKNGSWLFSHGHIVQAPLQRENPKVGRNEPCPCGSGKKFKKCCA